MFALSNSTPGFVLVLTRGDQQQWGAVYANEISADSTIGRCFFFFAKVLSRPGLLLLSMIEGALIISLYAAGDKVGNIYYVQKVIIEDFSIYCLLLLNTL